MSAEELRDLLAQLAGQRPPFSEPIAPRALELLQPSDGLGYSQFNELMLLLGYDRVTMAFFQYLVDGSTEYHDGSAFRSLEELRTGVERFQKVAMYLFGNIKYAFKKLSRDRARLEYELATLQEIDTVHFKARHPPLVELNEIPPDQTYYLGYVVQDEIAERERTAPNDPDVLAQRAILEDTIAKGRQNHKAYLACDHLDVYIATSMRQRHEFAMISRLTREIFADRALHDLRLRYFDPTQAYCDNRIDKGLAEALMLRRAKCTVYLAQEMDTLGKDSELASTLAQGKPVIALIPEITKSFVESFLSDLGKHYPRRTQQEIALEQFRCLDPELAWTDDKVRRWLSERPDSADDVKEHLFAVMKRRYDSRARTLRERHPLGIQVNLETGVANGVLVVRTVRDCARLIRAIVTKTLRFSLQRDDLPLGYLMLREEISGCVFRVVTGDEMLTNTFWNYYLEPAE